MKQRASAAEKIMNILWIRHSFDACFTHGGLIKLGGLGLAMPGGDTPRSSHIQKSCKERRDKIYAMVAQHVIPADVLNFKARPGNDLT